MRIKNLAGLVIGQHLAFDGEGYRLHVTAEETKTGRPYVACVPHELTGYIDEWLRFHRPALQLMAPGPSSGNAAGPLWIDRWGPSDEH